MNKILNRENKLQKIKVLEWIRDWWKKPWFPLPETALPQPVPAPLPQQPDESRKDILEQWPGHPSPLIPPEPIRRLPQLGRRSVWQPPLH